MSPPDLLKTVGAFVSNFVERSKQGKPLSADEWYAKGAPLLEALRDATYGSRNAEDLVATTTAWTELSAFLKALIIGGDDAHFPGFVEQACLEWWDAVTERQLALGLPHASAYRAMAAYVLVKLALRRRDRGSALRWASLGYLADKLSDHPGGGGNEVALRFGLGVAEESVELFDEHVTRATGQGVTTMPEWLLAEALDDPRGISLVAASDAYAHHPSRPFIKAATEHVFSDDGTANEKGERLERLVAFFVSTVPGMRPRRRLLASGSSAEHDVVATLFGETPYPLPANAPEWLIECKNTKDAVAAQQVGHFLAKMLRAGAKFGIIVAKSGLTKDEPALKYAERFLSDFCLRQGVVCLVVDAAEVLALGDAGTFRGLVDRLYEKSRFGE